MKVNARLGAIAESVALPCEAIALWPDEAVGLAEVDELFSGADARSEGAR